LAFFVSKFNTSDTYPQLSLQDCNLSEIISHTSQWRPQAKEEAQPKPLVEISYSYSSTICCFWCNDISGSIIGSKTQSSQLTPLSWLDTPIEYLNKMNNLVQPNSPLAQSITLNNCRDDTVFLQMRRIQRAALS